MARAPVLVGLVMIDGWSIAHHVFAGNWRDAKTVPQVLRDLEQRRRGRFTPLPAASVAQGPDR
jgi:hypothetical protein